MTRLRAVNLHIGALRPGFIHVPLKIREMPDPQPNTPPQSALTQSALTLSFLPLSGGALALCRLPGLLGDLTADLAVLAAFRPALVLSLTEPAEMTRLGAKDLPDRLARADIPWTRFPIRDFDIPPTTADWAQLSARLHGTLAGAGRIVLHCRGGLGRSGMIALRLMIEAGENPAAALPRLRRARPGVVETPAQEAWARATLPTPHAPRAKEPPCPSPPTS